LPNSEPRLGTLRRPRLLARLNGAPVANAVSARVASNNHYAADRFSLVVALGETAAATWMSADRMLVEIGIGLDLSTASLVEGEVDQVELDAVRRLVFLTGRDLTARLIEARTQESFSNRTASEIATLLAGRRGLSADVARTTTPVGRYWQLQRDRITLDQFSRATTEWDLLVTLAGLEGFDVWVAGTTLHFRPRDQAGAAATVLRASPGPWGGANVTGLRLERSLTLARDIEVVVKSWNARQQQSFLRRARRRGGSTGDQTQRYVLVVPNLTPDEALKLAQRKLAELTRHERVVVAEMPGELAMAPRQRLRIEATNTDFDQDYWIDEVDRTLHTTRGFTQTVRARNASTTSQATTPSARLAG
jgi:phage protein D